jgi:uncharacterized membrane protein YdjX (TVP38/TMEM64 family)
MTPATRNSDPELDPTSIGSRSIWRKLIKPAILLAIVATFVFVYTQFGDSLSLRELVKHEQSLRAYEQNHAWEVLGAALLVYAIVSAFSIPGGAVALSLFYGSYFGFLRAVAIVSFGSTAGATMAFLASRYLFHDAIQNKFADRLPVFNKKLAKEGAFYLFSLRLIPAVPFSLLNLVMGLTQMKTVTYWWVSQLGMLPGTMAYVYAGSTLKLSALAKDGFQGLGWEFLVAFIILGLLPIAVKKVLSRFQLVGRQPAPTDI